MIFNEILSLPINMPQPRWHLTSHGLDCQLRHNDAYADDLNNFGTYRQPRISHRRLKCLMVILIVHICLFWAFEHGLATERQSSLQPASEALTRLNEIIFHPAAGQPQAVELKTDRDRVAGLQLINTAGLAYSLPDVGVALPPGALLLILFDGQSRVDGHTIHADLTTFFDAAGDSLRLLDAEGIELDHVSWLPGDSQAVGLGRGGALLAPDPGSAIARLPTSTTPGPFDWFFFDPHDTTLGEPNPYPGVAILRPSSGAVLVPEPLSLSWYPAPRAVQYLVEIARDATFANLVFTLTVDAPLVTTPTLAAGTYVWRVQAVFADGRRASFSPVHTFEVEPVSALTIRGPAQADQRVTLDETAIFGGTFPSLSQHKDTNMILLESADETGNHAYDRDHHVFGPGRPRGQCQLRSRQYRDDQSLLWRQY